MNQTIINQLYHQVKIFMYDRKVLVQPDYAFVIPSHNRDHQLKFGNGLPDERGSTPFKENIIAKS